MGVGYFVFMQSEVGPAFFVSSLIKKIFQRVPSSSVNQMSDSSTFEIEVILGWNHRYHIVYHIGESNGVLRKTQKSSLLKSANFLSSFFPWRNRFKKKKLV